MPHAKKTGPTPRRDAVRRAKFQPKKGDTVRVSQMKELVRTGAIRPQDGNG